MLVMKRKIFICCVYGLLLSAFISAEEADLSYAETNPQFPYWTDNPSMDIRNPGFQGGLKLGTVPPTIEREHLYQKLILSVQYSIEKFRIALNLPLTFRLDLSTNISAAFEIDEWVPKDLYHGLDIYLNMIDITYGGVDDPFFLKMGRLRGIKLGNGTIVNRYTNTLYLPNKPISGLAFNVDPVDTSFPYIGIQGFVANLSRQDLIGARSFIRPFAFITDKNIPARLTEFGATFVIDRFPLYDYNLTSEQGLKTNEKPETTANSVMIYGADMRVPAIASPSFSMDFYLDYVYQNAAHGSLVGFDMRIIRFIFVSTQLTYAYGNMMFEYFNESYDIMRSERYKIFSGENKVQPGFGWKGKIGFFFLENKIGFEMNAAGGITKDSMFSMRAQFSMHEGTIPALQGFSMTLYYEKLQFNTAQELAELKDSAIGGEIGIRVTPVVFQLGIKVLNATHTPTGWKFTSDVGVSIAF